MIVNLDFASSETPEAKNIENQNISYSGIWQVLCILCNRVCKSDGVGCASFNFAIRARDIPGTGTR